MINRREDSLRIRRRPRRLPSFGALGGLIFQAGGAHQWSRAWLSPPAVECCAVEQRALRQAA
jgi:hypothetical protein